MPFDPALRPRLGALRDKVLLGSVKLLPDALKRRIAAAI